MSHYFHLTQIGNRYHDEEGKSPHREDFLNSLANNYRTAVMRLKVAAANAAAPADYRVEAAGGRASVKAQAAKFENLEASQAALKTALNKAKDALARQERFLSRMGAKVHTDPAHPDFGKIDWGFSTQTVVYDKQLADQGKTRLRVRGGRLFTDDAFLQPFDTRLMVTANMGPGYAIYVMSDTGNIHVSSHSVGYRHHSSLLAGQNVAGAGEMQVWNGTLRWISNKSGHYFPEVAHFLQTIHSLNKKQIPLGNVRLSFLFDGSPKQGVPYPNVDAWLATQLGPANQLEYDKLLRYLMAIPYPDFVALATPKGWRWVNDTEIAAGKRGVVTIATGAAVPHDEVRRWLKSTGAQRVAVAPTTVQPGLGR